MIFVTHFSWFFTNQCIHTYEHSLPSDLKCANVAPTVSLKGVYKCSLPCNYRPINLTVPVVSKVMESVSSLVKTFAADNILILYFFFLIMMLSVCKGSKYCNLDKIFKQGKKKIKNRKQKAHDKLIEWSYGLPSIRPLCFWHETDYSVPTVYCSIGEKC